MTIGRSCALCCAHVVLFAGPVFGQPAWDLGESRVRVFADVKIVEGDGCPLFDDALLLEVPGAPRADQSALLDASAASSFARVTTEFRASAFTTESIVATHAGNVGSGDGCAARLSASSRVEAPFGAIPGHRLTCFDVRFDLSGMLGDPVTDRVWFRVLSGDASLVVDTSSFDGDEEVSGRLAGDALTGGGVLIESVVPRVESADGFVAIVESHAVARVFTADLAEPFGMLDGEDVDVFVDGYLAADCAFDYDGSGWVDLGDIDVFLGLFAGGACPAVAITRPADEAFTRRGTPCAP